MFFEQLIVWNDFVLWKALLPLLFYTDKPYFFTTFSFFLSLSNFLWMGTWKHVYLQFSTGSTQEGISWHNWKIVNWNVKNRYEQNGLRQNLSKFRIEPQIITHAGQ